MFIRQAPVDATGGAIRLRSIFPPVGQRRASEQQGIDPSTGNEHTAVDRVKLVTWGEKTFSLYFHAVESSIIIY